MTVTVAEFVQLTCLNCGCTFSRHSRKVKAGTKVFCTSACFCEYMAVHHCSKTKQTVLLLRQEHPEWSIRHIARSVGVTRQWVSRILNPPGKRKGVKMQGMAVCKSDIPSHREKDWLSAREVGNLLNIHYATVVRWASEGWLPAYRLHPTACWRFKYADVMNLLIKEDGGGVGTQA